eukprot:365151-Chlamydomonas_euryale.AAC.1
MMTADWAGPSSSVTYQRPALLLLLDDCCSILLIPAHLLLLWWHAYCSCSPLLSHGLAALPARHSESGLRVVLGHLARSLTAARALCR